MTEYWYYVRLCSDSGSISTVAYSSSSWTADVGVLYYLDMEMYGNEIICSMYDSSGNEESTFSATDSTWDVSPLHRLSCYCYTRFSL